MSKYDIIERATNFSRDFEVESFRKKDQLDAILDKTIEFLHEEIRETKDALAINDKPEIIDGFGDVAFIALNGIYKAFCVHGDDHDVAMEKVTEVMKRICEANLGKKQSDGTIKYVNGKVQKPESWSPPEYQDLLG